MPIYRLNAKCSTKKLVSKRNADDNTRVKEVPANAQRVEGSPSPPQGRTTYMWELRTRTSCPDYEYDYVHFVPGLEKKSTVVPGAGAGTVTII